MLRPPAATVRRTCEAKGLDPDTAWAVSTGPPENPNLLGVRATEGEATRVANAYRRKGKFVQVTTVAELLREPVAS